MSSIYWDKATQMPEWATVRTGLFGLKETFAPLALAKTGTTDEVTFQTDKDTITAAPKIDPDGELSEAEEADLFAHYGLDYSQRSPTGLPETPGQTTGAAGQMAGPAGQADEAMTRSEERMRVGTATEPAGRAAARRSRWAAASSSSQAVARTPPVRSVGAFPEAAGDVLAAGFDVGDGAAAVLGELGELRLGASGSAAVGGKLSA